MALMLIDHGSDEYRQMVNLRYAVLRKPLGLNFSPEELEMEKHHIHIGAFEDNKLLGCCFVKFEEPGTAQLRQMAVINSLQGKGIGRALMQFAENIAIDKGYRKMIMNARKTAAGFYSKLGYEIIGEEFEQLSIPHVKMEKHLIYH